jgi:hypothetical protein
VSAEEFEGLLDRAPETVHAYTPIGATHERAYIESWSLVPVLGERRTVLWTPVAELPPEVLARVKGGR